MWKTLNLVLGVGVLSFLGLTAVVGLISANGVLAGGLQKHAATPAQLEAVQQAWFSIVQLSMGCFAMSGLVILVLLMINGFLGKFPPPMPSNWGAWLVVAMILGVAFSLVLAQRINRVEPGRYGIEYEGQQEVIVYGRRVWVDKDYFLRLKKL